MNKKTTWQGLLFLVAIGLIVIAGIVYAVSEYTVNPHKGQVQENWSIVIFVAGVLALITSRVGAN
jgi:predicted membrane channel-forming protein YqfA (hemolysin III family)